MFRVGSADVNEGGRDYNIRYCEQKTAGGGWTVSLVSDCESNQTVFIRIFSNNFESKI